MRILLEPTQDIQVLVEPSSVLSQIPVEVLDAKRRQTNRRRAFLTASIRDFAIGISAAEVIHQRVALWVRLYDRPFAGRRMVVGFRRMKMAVERETLS